MKYFLLIVAIGVFSFTACKNNKDATNLSATDPIEAVTEVVIPIEADTISQEWPDEAKEQHQRILKGVSDSLFFKIERTSCFGRCPTYSIEVFNSGYVSYNGRRNVEKIGFYESKLDKTQLNFILKMANDINYFKLDDRYDGNMTDVPSTITLLKYNDNIKVVVDRVRGPEELKAFQKEMDNLLLNLSYTEKEMY